MLQLLYQLNLKLQDVSHVGHINLFPTNASILEHFLSVFMSLKDVFLLKLSKHIFIIYFDLRTS